MKDSCGFSDGFTTTTLVTTGLAVAFVFLLAGIAKLDDPTLTIGFVSWGFGVPASVARWLVYALGAGEIAIAVLMAYKMNRQRWPAGVALGVVAFFVGLLLAVAIRFPTKPISCACFGSLQPPLGGRTILSQLKFDAILATLLTIHLIAGHVRRRREKPCMPEVHAAKA